MTGTITPPSKAPNLIRKDATLRENDYLLAISKWVSLGYPIVFCENSNSKSIIISNLLSSSKIDFEYLTFQSMVSHLGKGHGEAEIFNYAFINSKILQEVDWVYKVTGRYYLKNASKIIEATKFDEKTFVSGNLSANLSWCDSRIFGFQPIFYDKYFSKFLKLINEKEHVYLENLLCRAILNCISDGNAWCFLKEYPIYEGVYGTDNKKYKNNLVSITKQKVF